MQRKRTKRTKNIKRDTVANLSKYATPNEAAVILEVTSRTIRRMLEKGELQGARVGGHFKISRASIESIVRLIEGSHTSTSENYTDQRAPLAAASEVN